MECDDETGIISLKDLESALSALDLFLTKEKLEVIYFKYTT